MELTVNFYPGEFVYYIDGKQNIKKAKIERIIVIINNEKYCVLNECKEVTILYELEGVASRFTRDEIFKNFEEFKNVFQVKFNELDDYIE